MFPHHPDRSHMSSEFSIAAHSGKWNCILNISKSGGSHDHLLNIKAET